MFRRYVSEILDPKGRLRRYIEFSTAGSDFHELIDDVSLDLNRQYNRLFLFLRGRNMTHLFRSMDVI